MKKFDANTTVENLISVFLEVDQNQFKTLMQTTEMAISQNHKDILTYLYGAGVDSLIMHELAKRLNLEHHLASIQNDEEDF